MSKLYARYNQPQLIHSSDEFDANIYKIIIFVQVAQTIVIISIELESLNNFYYLQDIVNNILNIQDDYPTTRIRSDIRGKVIR